VLRLNWETEGGGRFFSENEVGVRRSVGASISRFCQSTGLASPDAAAPLVPERRGVKPEVRSPANKTRLKGISKTRSESTTALGAVPA